MQPVPAFLSEKEEQALQRMEQLAKLRRAGRNGWRDYAAFGAQVFGSGALTYWVYRSAPVSSSWLYVMAAVYALSGLVFFVINPLHRRVEALEQLLEAEIKRNAQR